MILVKEVSTKSLKALANTVQVITKPDMIKGGTGKGSGNDIDDSIGF